MIAKNKSENLSIRQEDNMSYQHMSLGQLLSTFSLNRPYDGENYPIYLEIRRRHGTHISVKDVIRLSLLSGREQLAYLASKRLA